MRAVRRLGGWAVCGYAVLLTAQPLNRLSAQDTSAIDRGVRIGIIYRPGVRPGLVMLPRTGMGLDSVRGIVARDLDYSDRFEVITLPGGDSIRLATSATAPRGTTTRRPGTGIAATRVLFVKDGKVYQIDQDGAEQKLVSSTNRQAMSPAWGSDGRQFAYMEFQAGKGWLYLQETATGKRTPVSTTGSALDFTPAFSPDAQTLAFSRATEEGTDLYTINIKSNCCLRRLTVGRFSDNLSPTFSPDGQRIAFVSTRPGLPQIYVMAADGTDQQLFAPFDYGATGSSNAPEWSPDGQTVAFHRDVGGTLQVFVLDVRTRAVRQLTSVGRNEDPTWAPDSRHMAFVSDRSGYRQLWIIDVETGRIRPLLQQSGARLPAWSPRLPETASSAP